MGVSLLHYRPWRGEFRDPAWSFWPILRVGLHLMVRRRLFWGLYALSLLFFLMYFFGQYLLAYAEMEAGEVVQRLIIAARNDLKLNGSAETFQSFLRFQASMVVIVLALAGSLLVGNDFQYGSLTFYLSKPLGPWHYLLGKFLAVGVFVNLMTTVPALVLFFQYGMVTTYDYYFDNWHLLVGILGSGLVLTVCLSLILVAMASWLRQTIPLIMAWTTLFLFLRMLSSALVRILQYHPRWRLIDLWNNLWLVSSTMLGLDVQLQRSGVPPRQPAVWEAALVLTCVCLLCLTYLNRRIRAVEIVK
jgi:ABC-2 type transport system permease protein